MLKMLLKSLTDKMNGRISVQGDLEKCEDWTSKTLRNPARYKVLHLGWNNSMHLYSLGGHRLSSSSAEKEMASWWMPHWTRPASARSSQYGKLACVGRSMASRRREPLFLSGEATPGILHPILDVEILESVRQTATGMARGMEWSGASKDRLRELGLFSLTEEWSNDSLKIPEGKLQSWWTQILPW